jgi:pilus assembly protein Flp/PilA
MTENVRVRTSRLLQSIRQDREPPVVQSGRRQVTFLVGDLGEADHSSVIPGEDGGGEGDGAERVAEDVTHQSSLGIVGFLLGDSPGVVPRVVAGCIPLAAPERGMHRNLGGGVSGFYPQKERHMRKFGQSLVNFLKNEDGPTAVEYAVMLALIIVVCISAITTLGSNANNTFSYVGTQVGNSSS